MRSPLSIPALLLALFLAGSGCDSRPPPGALGPVLRFIADPPQTLLSRRDFTSTTVVFDWSLRDLHLFAHWQQDQETRHFDVSGKAAAVTWDRTHLIFERELGLQASAIDRVDVVLKSQIPSSYIGDVSLLWAAADEPFAPDRRILVQGGELVGNRRQYRFRTLDSARWQGTIFRLRLICRLAPKARARLLRITAYAETLREENLQELAATGVQVSLGGQLRSALPGLPHSPHERRIEVPADAELRFAYGLEPGAGAAVRFVVVISPADQSTAPRKLFEDTLQSETEPGWHTARVDLSPFAGQDMVLRLEIHPDGPLDLGEGLPLWGHPEVLAPRH